MAKNRRNRLASPPQDAQRQSHVQKGSNPSPDVRSRDPHQDRQLVTAASGTLRESRALSADAIDALPKGAEEVATMPADILAEFRERIHTLDAALQELEKERAEQEQVLAVLKQQKTDLDQERGQLDERRSALDTRDRSLVEQESALELREADARNGFLAQQRTALKSLRDEIQRLEGERNAVIANGEQDRREVRERIERERAAFQAELDREREALETERHKLAEQAQQITLERNKLDQSLLNQDALERQTRQAIEGEFHREIMDYKRRIAQFTKNAGQDEARIQEQQKALEGFEDLMRECARQGFDGPEDLLQRFAELTLENRRLREAARERPTEDLEADNEALRDRCDDQERALEDRARDIEALRTELSVSRVGVLEKQNLAQEKRVLEQHKRALDSAVADLERRLDDLTTRQQGGEVFPALAKMDRELMRSTPTQDAPILGEFAAELRQRIATATDTPLYYTEQLIRLFLGGLAMSQLHILQGISGTGKTSLAIAFAKAVGGHCTVVPVQAGWRDRDDLLGHFNAFERRFYERECLQAIYRAGTDGFKNRINVVLLDEMNLSHPEQYFAEFLSVLERRPSERGIVLTETAVGNPPTLLRDGRILPVPENLWFIGTANQDETTKGFADKTFDRAHVMELPRSEAPFKPSTPSEGLPVGLDSLKKRFSDAQRRHQKTVGAALTAIQSSEFSNVLDRDFNLGWGNRLEQQAKRFVPVVVEAGGSVGEAFDHLLAMRLFRPGKITERYDISSDSLRTIERELTAVWKRVDPKNELPITCLERLEREVARKEQQG